jgi:dGTPase
LRVAQIARSIAENFLGDENCHDALCALGGLDADVAEAAGLAHDIGHPPFGHAGEETLDEAARLDLKLADGFEGNAQTLRIVTKIECRNSMYDGMDLTRATRGALLKYPWLRSRVPESYAGADYLSARKWAKFNAYDSEKDDLEDARSFLPDTFPAETQSLEASIMDASDDITYAVHDLEDFIMAGTVDLFASLEDLQTLAGGESTPLSFEDPVKRWARGYPGYFDRGQLQEAARVIVGHLSILPKRFDGSSDDIATVRDTFSRLINKYVGSLRLPYDLNSPAPHWRGGPFIALDVEPWHEVQILKQLMKSQVVARSDVAVLQRGQQAQLRSLVRLLMEWKDSKDDFIRLPHRLREQIKLIREFEDGGVNVGVRRPGRPYRGAEERAILDYLCTLTDGQCGHLYRLLTGATAPSITGAFSV